VPLRAVRLSSIRTRRGAVTPLQWLARCPRINPPVPAARRYLATECAIKRSINGKTFRPWALVTGALSGFGREFVRSIAASWHRCQLVMRRGHLLEESGRELENAFDVQWRATVADLFREDAVGMLAAATREVGCVNSLCSCATIRRHSPMRICPASSIIEGSHERTP
jgi:hypothetical protein